MSAETLYEILEAHADANAEEIRKQYRQLALRYHPDRNGNSGESTLRFQIVQRAYETLSHAESRRAYDSYLATSAVVAARKRTTRPRSPGTSSSGFANVEYLNSQVNYILWEIEDILAKLKKVESPREEARTSIESAIAELLTFFDEWVLEPAGFPDYFYKARLIDAAPPRFSAGRGVGEHVPYVNVGDYFFALRKRANDFLGKNSESLLARTHGNGGVSLADGIIEFLDMAYHQLGKINSRESGVGLSLEKYRHAQPGFGPAPSGGR